MRPPGPLDDWYGDMESFLPASARTGPVFPLDAFNAEGRAIAALIQNELPGWTVVYRDEPLEWSSTESADKQP